MLRVDGTLHFVADHSAPKYPHMRGSENHHVLTSLVKEDMLMVVKLFIDWLKVNPEVTKCEVGEDMSVQR